MPVTAKLSRKFYERLGDDVANELVEWLNQVDATYRSDLRELNELNFARFDAKLEQHWAQLDAKWEQRWVQLDAKWEQRWVQLDAKWEQRWVQLDAKVEAAVARLDARMSAFEARIIRWMFLFWVGQLGTTIALIKLR